METISLVAELQCRRRFSTRDMLPAVAESNGPWVLVSYEALEYGISPSLHYESRTRMVEGGKQELRQAMACSGFRQGPGAQTPETGARAGAYH